MKLPSIYVEARIRCSMEQLWAHTQQPELHQQWDLRFTEIAYLPRASEAVPQQFLYATRIGFGLGVAGAQRFREGWLAFGLPRMLAALADVEEWYDDEAGCYRIRVEVRNPVLGKLFGYSGSFRATWQHLAPDRIPAYALPLRHESRE